MNSSIELQVISKILTSDDIHTVDRLCEFDMSYYEVFQKEIGFIFKHKDDYGKVPDAFTFTVEFPEFTILPVNEPLEYLETEMTKNKQRILLVQTFNKLKSLGSADVSDAWDYVGMQYEQYLNLDTSMPMDIVHSAKERSRKVIEYSKQARIPTGFPEIDKVMYGGLSTVEELLILIARTNTGKSWVGAKLMETAQANGFNVLYYSPEMQSCYLATRFDTWRSHFPNSKLYRGAYPDEYTPYLDDLERQIAGVYILEDKDAPGGTVTMPYLKKLVKRLHIKELIIDGLSYVEDVQRGESDYIRYKHIAADAFKISKDCSCAVVIMMQANRETKENKDDKGAAFPTIYNAEGSDHPGRIATQVFAMRQVFEKHVLDIRLEKSRAANNQRPEFSYAWDIDTGNIQYIPNEEDTTTTESIIPTVMPDLGIKTNTPPLASDLSPDDVDEELEF